MRFDSRQSGNPKKHIAALKKTVDTVCLGEPSLYNSLNLAVQTLKSVLLLVFIWCTVLLHHLNHHILLSWRHMPGHTSREILIILSSLTTCDPANIYELIKGRRHPDSPVLWLVRAANRPFPPTDSKVTQGASVRHRAVSGGARVHSVDERDGRHLSRHPGWGSLQGAPDAARQTSASQFVFWMLPHTHGLVHKDYEAQSGTAIMSYQN